MCNITPTYIIEFLDGKPGAYEGWQPLTDTIFCRVDAYDAMVTDYNESMAYGLQSNYRATCTISGEVVYLNPLL